MMLEISSLDFPLNMMLYLVDFLMCCSPLKQQEFHFER